MAINAARAVLMPWARLTGDFDLRAGSPASLHRRPLEWGVVYEGDEEEEGSPLRTPLTTYSSLQDGDA